MDLKKPEKGFKKFFLGIQPLGTINPLNLKIIAASVAGQIGINTDILPHLDLPESAWDSRRAQYDAAKTVKILESKEFEDCHTVIAVTDEDLYIPVFSYVFGEARMGGKIAVLSIFRLEGNKERMIKVALHEFGHLCRLGHCMEKRCVMNFSKSREQLDQCAAYYCEYCTGQITYQLSFSVTADLWRC